MRIAALLWLSVAGAVSAADYAGAVACRNCHPAQFETQSTTSHARALAPAKPPQPGDWAFGAGQQAITFVRRLDPEHYLEEGRSWYRSIDNYARTPGHKTSAGIRDRIFDPAANILRCFACHSTGPLRVTDASGIVPHELGVRCEACHGPAGDHILQPDRIQPKNPGRLSASEINSVCGACHRMPAKERDETSLRDPWNVRHQPFMLAASKCFTNSGGRLSCLTCHAPHQTLERNHDAYNRACQSCHPAPTHKVSLAGRDCVQCHMPSVQPQPHLSFANHRIGIYSKTESLVPISAVVRAPR